MARQSTSLTLCAFLVTVVFPVAVIARQQKHLAKSRSNGERARLGPRRHIDISAPADSVEAAFEAIAVNRVWGNPDINQHLQSLSGPGSMLQTTKRLRRCLGQWIARFNITSIVDAPCGDATWQGSIPGIHEVRYTGFDVSKHTLRRAKMTNANASLMRFVRADLTKRVPPRADLIMVRDVVQVIRRVLNTLTCSLAPYLCTRLFTCPFPVQHLPLRLGVQLLTNAKVSGARWLAVSTYGGPKATNREVKVGGYYQNNIHLPPFNAPDPVVTCPNYDSDGSLPGFGPSMMHLIELSQWKWNPDAMAQKAPIV